MTKLLSILSILFLLNLVSTASSAQHQSMYIEILQNDSSTTRFEQLFKENIVFSEPRVSIFYHGDSSIYYFMFLDVCVQLKNKTVIDSVEFNFEAGSGDTYFLPLENGKLYNNNEYHIYFCAIESYEPKIKNIHIQDKKRKPIRNKNIKLNDSFSLIKSRRCKGCFLKFMTQGFWYSVKIRTSDKVFYNRIELAPENVRLSSIVNITDTYKDISLSEKLSISKLSYKNRVFQKYILE